MGEIDEPASGSGATQVLALRRSGRRWGLVVHPKALEFRKKLIMKTYCKNVDITDRKFIEKAVLNYLDDKRNNHQVIEFFSHWSGRKYSEVKYLLTRLCNPVYISYLEKAGTPYDTCIQLYNEGKQFFYKVIEEISAEMAVHLKNRTVREHIISRKYGEKVIRYLEITDGANGKKRDLGLESFLFRLYETVANAAGQPLFDAKVGMYQVASVKGKGQKFGRIAVARWMAGDPEGTKFGAKGDVKKCYPSIDHGVLKGMLHRDLHKAETVQYLFDVIIALYEEYPNPKSKDPTKGILIGSPVSKDLCNYYMSAMYHYAAERLAKVKTRRGKTQRTRLFRYQMYYMDDIQIYGQNKRDVQLAMVMIVKYAKEVLLLTIKPDWRKFRSQYKKADGNTKGCLLDFMGFRFHGGEVATKYYNGRPVRFKKVWITIRRKTFLKARRKFMRFIRKIKRRQVVSFRYAKSTASYYGCFKQTNAATFRKKNKIDQIMHICRKVVSDYAKTVDYSTDKYYQMWRRKIA